MPKSSIEMRTPSSPRRRSVSMFSSRLDISTRSVTSSSSEDASTRIRAQRGRDPLEIALALAELGRRHVDRDPAAPGVRALPGARLRQRALEGPIRRSSGSGRTPRRAARSRRAGAGPGPGGSSAPAPPRRPPGAGRAPPAASAARARSRASAPCSSFSRRSRSTERACRAGVEHAQVPRPLSFAWYLAASALRSSSAKSRASFG